MGVTKDTTSNPYGEENQVSSGWMKFETPGNSIRGTIVDIFTKPGTDGYPDQKVFVLDKALLEEADISVEGTGSDQVATITGVKSSESTGKTNTPIKTTSEYMMRMTREFNVGDIVGFVFTHEIPTKKNPAKSIKVFKFGVDEKWVAENKNSYKESAAVQAGEDISVEDNPF